MRVTYNCTQFRSFILSESDQLLQKGIVKLYTLFAKYKIVKMILLSLIFS